MMIRKYNLLSVPFFAFFSKKAYRDVGKNWRGVNLAYLFLLLAICCLPPALTLRKHFMESDQQFLIKQIPDIEITDGRVVVEQRQAHYITRKDGTPAFIIDTTGSMNYIENPHVVALLMESALILRTGENTFNTIDLSGVEHFHLDSSIANSWMQLAESTFTPVSYGILLLVSYLGAMLLLLLAAMIGLILSRAMHGTLNYTSSLRVATVAATPSIIFMTISAAAGIGIAEEIYLAVTLIYFVAGIKACAAPLGAGDQEHIDLKSYLHEEEAGAQEAA